MILLVGLGSTVLIGFLWVRSLRNHLRITREMRYGWARVGDLLEERFTISNLGWAPGIWVELIDRSTVPGYEASRVTGVSAHAITAWITHQACSRRGLYTLGPTELRSGDPLGVFTLHIYQPDSSTLLVTPAILPLPSIQVATGGRAGEGRPARRVIEQSVLSSGVREYTPGDSLHRVHWPTTARRDETFVRTFDHMPAGDWWILVDLDHRFQCGEGLKSTEETIIILAASLADRGLRAGIPVGLISNGSEMAWLSPRSGDGQRWQILEALARAAPGDYPLATLLEKVAPSIRHQASLVVISANPRGDWLPGLLKLAWRGTVPTVLALDLEAFAGGQSVRGLEAVLDEQSITHYTITPDLLNPAEGQPAPENAWEWRTSPLGRAIPIHRPRDLAWRDLR
ncbi:MAG: DUF58 domain-containing protein [Anaerolineaceae bacterium]|nr:DUF58 domain-containing protein [Anaerolineaceae bacterium]